MPEIWWCNTWTLPSHCKHFKCKKAESCTHDLSESTKFMTKEARIIKLFYTLFHCHLISNEFIKKMLSLLKKFNIGWIWPMIFTLLDLFSYPWHWIHNCTYLRFLCEKICVCKIFSLHTIQHFHTNDHIILHIHNMDQYTYYSFYSITIQPTILLDSLFYTPRPTVIPIPHTQAHYQSQCYKLGATIIQILHT